MQYQFPEIRHLDDVRAAIEGRDEFIIAERDWGYVVNYMVSMTDTFPEITEDQWWCPGCKQLMSATMGCGSQRCPEPVNLAAIRRECRGMIFCPNTSRIVRRPLTKFFNIGERDETQIHRLDFTKHHRVYTKLDGSMIVPFEVGYGSGMIRWGTKMGLSEVALKAEVFVAQHPKYAAFARWCISQDISPIFEYTAPDNRIVVKYDDESLTLLTARHMITGEYLDIRV